MTKNSLFRPASIRIYEVLIEKWDHFSEMILNYIAEQKAHAEKQTAILQAENARLLTSISILDKKFNTLLAGHQMLLAHFGLGACEAPEDPFPVDLSFGTQTSRRCYATPLAP